MSVENPLWGAPSIHGELLKLGVEVAQSGVVKYMVKRRGPPSQDRKPSCVTTRRTLPPSTYSLFQLIDLLYALVIVRFDRRDLIWINVPENPTAVGVARQITEAFPLGEALGEALHYLVPDRDRIYGSVRPIARHGHSGQLIGH
jgi:hypothetical protein